MTSNTISETVYREIIKVFISADLLPSTKAITELAAAAGKSEKRLKNDYTTQYRQSGNDGDPWDPVEPLMPD